MMRRLLILACVAVVGSAAAAPAPAPGAAAKAKKFLRPASSIRTLIEPMGGAFATDRITVDGQKIGYMYREKPANPLDSGWRFFSGDESQAYINDLRHTQVYDVNTIANYDPAIIPLLSTPAPCAFEKIPGKTGYRRVE